VSECGIGSAYLKAFEAAELLQVTEPLEHGKSRIHLLAVAGDERALAADPCRIRDSVGAFEQLERLGESRCVAVYATDQPQRLGFDDRKLAGPVIKDAIGYLDAGRPIMIQQAAQATLEAFHLTEWTRLKFIERVRW
jgi:hypothetical protein